MYQSPRVGKAYSQVYAPHIKFYDRARVLSKGPTKGLEICTLQGASEACSRSTSTPHTTPATTTSTSTVPGEVGNAELQRLLDVAGHVDAADWERRGRAGGLGKHVRDRYGHCDDDHDHRGDERAETPSAHDAPLALAT